MSNIIMRIDDADECVIGYVSRCGQETFLVYDRDKLLLHYVAQGMTAEEADEHVSVNIESAWVGPGTPAVLQRATIQEIEDLLDAEYEKPD